MADSDKQPHFQHKRAAIDANKGRADVKRKKTAPVVAPAATKPASKPSRWRVVRIRRRGGAVVQDCDVYIGRNCFMGGWKLSQSKWHNPFPAKNGDNQTAVDKFRAYILKQPELMAALPELKGKVVVIPP